MAGTHIEATRGMRLTAVTIVSLLFVGCHGESVPRDYQNSPPAVSHPVDNKSQAPAQHTTRTSDPEPSSGAEGTTAPYVPKVPSPLETPTDTASKGRADLPPNAVVKPPKK